MFINSTTFLEMKKIQEKRENTQSGLSNNDQTNETSQTNEIKNKDHFYHKIIDRKSIIDLFRTTEEIVKVNSKAIEKAKNKFTNKRTKDIGYKNPLKGSVVNEKLMFSSIEDSLKKEKMKV